MTPADIDALTKGIAPVIKLYLAQELSKAATEIRAGLQEPAKEPPAEQRQ